MSDLPGIEETDELVAARNDLMALRNEALVAGLGMERFQKLVQAVRKMDAEIIGAIHQHRISEFYPYFPESFQAEEDGYEAAEKWMRVDVLKEWEL